MAASPTVASSASMEEKAITRLQTNIPSRWGMKLLFKPSSPLAEPAANDTNYRSSAVSGAKVPPAGALREYARVSSR